MDFTRSSRKCWGLIRCLGAAQKTATQAQPAVSANAVATHLVRVAKVPLEIVHQRQVRNEWRQFYRQKITRQLNNSAEPFQVSELETALENMKSGTAAG